MKKCCFCIVVVMFLALIAVHIEAAEFAGVQGVVEILEKTDGPGRPARPGMPIFESQIIRTGERSWCIVKLDEDNSFRIRQNTQITIEKLMSESAKPDGRVVREVRLNLLDGVIAAKLNRLPDGSEFNVKGPVAIAGASGTAFLVAADGTTRRTGVSVFDHEVSVAAVPEQAQSLLLEEFQSVEASPWDSLTLRATGRGVPSESDLGPDWVRETEDNIVIRASGRGPDFDGAKRQALLRLSLIVLALPADSETTIERAVSADAALAHRIFLEIHRATVVENRRMSDGGVEVECEVALKRLKDALGKTLDGITQSVIPVTPAGYEQKFGAQGRLGAQQAARDAGFRNLAEALYETVIDAATRLRDLADKNIAIRTAIHDAVKEGVVADTLHFSDGSIIVILELQGEIVLRRLSASAGGALGKNYLSGPALIDFEDFEVLLELDETGMERIESVRITNFVGSIEVFYPNGEHRLLKTGEVPLEIAQDVSGIIFRVLKGTLTMEVTIVDPQSGEIKTIVREFVTSDLVRITLSRPDQYGESQWQVFVNQSFTSLDRQIRNQVETGRAGEGSIDETGFETPPATEPPGTFEIPEEPASPDGEEL